MIGWPATLYLEKGHCFDGIGFGADTTLGGEAVFNTGMAGYQEVFTDPSYYQQIVVMTYPHIGNYGINEADVESRSLFLSGVVVREYCEAPSNWRSTSTLDQYMEKAGIPGISDVDTREITTLLREEGAQRAILFSSQGLSESKKIERAKELLKNVPSMDGLGLVDKVSCREMYEFKEPLGNDSQGNIVVYDFGVKTNILRELKQRNFKVWVVPYNTPHQEVLKMSPKAVVLSNGPGDPAGVDQSVKEIASTIGKVPILAICMGHQLLARAMDCKTYKLKFGHHGVNHPVLDLITQRIFITSQNHGFSIRREDLNAKDVAISHVSLNDQTIEGFLSQKLKFYSVQFHPEAKPGPTEGAQLFDYFLRGFLK